MDKLALTAFFDEMDKIAGERKDRVIGAAAKAQPWVSSAVKAAVPAALSAQFLIPATEQPWLGRKSKIVAGAGALGAGAGIVHRYLKEWARKHKRHKTAKEILRQEKLGAMAGDLRMKGLGGVKRPPFPTEDSKRHAFGMLRNAQKPGIFTAKAEPKNLIKPGPSFSQLAPMG